MNRIRFLRLKSGMKQEQLAQKILVSQSSLSGYENGKFEPDSKTLRKIADVFKVSVDYLLGGSEVSQEERNLTKIPIYQGMPNGTNTALFYFSEHSLLQPPSDSSGNYFGLYMDTDAMEPRICPGDLIIARRQPEVPNGSLAVVQAGQNRLIVKQVWKMTEGSLVLVSSNTKYGPDIYTQKEIASLPVQILGLVVEFHGQVVPH